VIFALGLGLLIFGATNTEEMTFLGITVHPRLGKGLGIIAMIFSAITFLAIFGNAQPPLHAERDRSTRPEGSPQDGANHVTDSRISRRA
jgi:hypothetical protein